MNSLINIIETAPIYVQNERTKDNY